MCVEATGTGRNRLIVNFLDYRTWDDEPDNRVSMATHRRGNEWSTESGWSLILSDVPGVVHGQAGLSDEVQPPWDQQRSAKAWDHTEAVAKHKSILLDWDHSVTCLFAGNISHKKHSVHSCNIRTLSSHL